MKEKTFYAIINTCAALAIIIIIVTIAAFIHQATTINDTHYTIQAKVIGVDTASDTVQIEDSHGEIWKFFGTEDFQKGNSVIVLMDNQKTSTPYDDEILSVRLSPFEN